MTATLENPKARKGICQCGCISQWGLLLVSSSMNRWAHSVITKASNSVNERIARSRQRTQIRIEKRMRPKIYKALRKQEQEVVNRIAKGMAPIPWDSNTRWAQELYDAQIKEGMESAIAGWKAGGDYVADSRKAVTTTTMPAFGDDEIPDGVGVGGENGFLTSPTPAKVNTYFKETSRREASTHVNKIRSVFDEVSNRVDSAGNLVGLNAGQISTALSREMAGWSRTYSNLVARTGTNWANNEGAVGRYRSEGFTEIQWWATADELTCPFCLELHETVIGIEDAFVEAGGTLTAPTTNASGESVNVTLTNRPGVSTEHPPAHANCRCTALPFFRQSPNPI